MTKKRLKSSKKMQEGPDKKAFKSKPQPDKVSGLDNLRDQYQIIREDLLRLKNDLQKGYDLAKGTVEKKGFLGELLRSR
jgi:hypothetical protein